VRDEDRESSLRVASASRSEPAGLELREAIARTFQNVVAVRPARDDEAPERQPNFSPTPSGTIAF
jgi:hypothetical protein